VASAICTLAVSAPAMASSLSIHRHPKVVRYTHRDRISGRLSSGVRGRKLLLQKSVWPFTKPFRSVASKRTGRLGKYRFRVKPRIATRYRVVLARHHSVRSRRVTVYVGPLNFDVHCTIGGVRCRHAHTLSPGKHKLTVTVRTKYPTSVYAHESAKSLYWYYGQRNGSHHPPGSLGLTTVNSQHPLSSNTVRWHFEHSVTVPAGDWSFQIIACTIDDYNADGFALPGHHHCGASSLTHRQASHYVG
jgi:hypothetical protein